MSKPLDAAMQNTMAWKLDEIAREAGRIDRTDVGDPIDRGLILLRLLNEGGFELRKADGQNVDGKNGT